MAAARDHYTTAVQGTSDHTFADHLSCPKKLRIKKAKNSGQVLTCVAVADSDLLVVRVDKEHFLI